MNIIYELRKSKNISQQKLAKFLNVHQTAVSQWEKGRTMPDIETLKKLSDFFGVSTDYILGNENSQPTKKGVIIPVLGRVAAGIPIDAIEEILDYEEISLEMAGQGEHFALQIKGDSMEPKISDGDVVIVRKQPTVESGETAIVYVNGGEATCKKVIIQDNGIMLVASNSVVYEPQFYSNQQIEELPVVILGKVVELRAKF